MFKSLKVIKLIVFAGLLLAIILKMDYSTFIISKLYTDQLSYYPGDTVKFYASSNINFPITSKFKITSINNSFYDELEAQIIKQGNVKNILKNGLGYEVYSEYIIPKNIKSGIYLVNNKYPFVVKSKKKADIIVVYPAMNNIFYTPINEKNVFNEKLTTVSLLRNHQLDDYSRGFSKTLKELSTQYQVNYISDIDLDKKENFNTKLFIIYGKSTCWTPKMKGNFLSFQNKGGNLLNITSYFANNICWKISSNEIKMRDSSKAIKDWRNYDSLIPISISGVTNYYSGYSDKKEYNIIDNHEIFKNISNGVIKINATLFSAPPVVWHENEPNICINNITFYKSKILAFSEASYKKETKNIKGIFEFQQKSTSGKTIVLGSEDWCLQKNIGDKKQLQTITKNAVNYLLK